jgi:hypothetical protein
MTKPTVDDGSLILAVATAFGLHVSSVKASATLAKHWRQRQYSILALVPGFGEVYFCPQLFKFQVQ